MSQLQDKYSSVVSAGHSLQGSPIFRFRSRTEFFMFPEMLPILQLKDAVWNALGAIDSTYSASDINIDVQVAGLASGASLTVATEESNLNIRQEPSTEAAVVGKAAKGSSVTLIEQTSDDWWKVKKC